MKLTPSQEQAVRDWAAAGASLSDIQTRLASEFDLHPSYMDVRFLVLDLGITLAEKPAPKPEPDLSKPQETAQEFGGPDSVPDEEAPIPGEDQDEYGDQEHDAPETSPDDAAPAAPASVSVTVSKLAQPGLALNGTVTFSDGVQANWGVTQRGELTLSPIDPSQDGYQPSREDIRAFQVELRRALTKMGMY